MVHPVRVPLGHRRGGVLPQIYREYSRGLDRCSAGVVITTILPDGNPAVLASRRGPGRPFAGFWWMQGSVVYAYESIVDALAHTAEKECGVRPRIEGVICVIRLCAEDMLTSMIQPCYVGYAPYEEVATHARSDQDHPEYRLLTPDDLHDLSDSETHPTIYEVFESALAILPPVVKTANR